MTPNHSITEIRKGGEERQKGKERKGGQKWGHNDMINVGADMYKLISICPHEHKYM